MSGAGGEVGAITCAAAGGCWTTTVLAGRLDPHAANARSVHRPVTTGTSRLDMGCPQSVFRPSSLNSAEPEDAPARHSFHTDPSFSPTICRLALVAAMRRPPVSEGLVTSVILFLSAFFLLPESTLRGRLVYFAM